MKYKVGMHVLVGGKNGYEAVITEIRGKMLIHISLNGKISGYLPLNNDMLYVIPDLPRYEQLTLF